MFIEKPRPGPKPGSKKEQHVHCYMLQAITLGEAKQIDPTLRMSSFKVERSPKGGYDVKGPGEIEVYIPVACCMIGARAEAITEWINKKKA